jgi:hypothetical protein
LLSGKGVSSTEFGAVWFYLDEVIGYPVSIVETGNFNRLELAKYNTFILADGFMTFRWTSKKQITEWIKNGGKVIAMNNALSVLKIKAYNLTLLNRMKLRKVLKKLRWINY